jgi:hypothetical protein
MATLIATKSPVAVQGTKANLNYSRDHTVDESLEYVVCIVLYHHTDLFHNVHFIVYRNYGICHK